MKKFIKATCLVLSAAMLMSVTACKDNTVDDGETPGNEIVNPAPETPDKPENPAPETPVNPDDGNTEPEEKKAVMKELESGAWKLTGALDDAIDYIQAEQLTDAARLKVYCDAFEKQADADGGYRGEYWGKIIRGGSIAYKYTGSEELYYVLSNSVCDMLENQEDSGRISTFPADKEFTGWDIWGRKYVLLGMTYFHEICKDEELKSRIASSVGAQVRYLYERIGGGDDKIDILQTSSDWGGMTSSAILGAVVKSYNITGDEKALDFATYILERGGSSMQGINCYEAALENKLKPAQYGIRKAYEVMSYFEGMYDYYLTTGSEKAKRAFLNYFWQVYENETTVIGGLATDVEEFDNSVHQQCDPTNTGRAMENCVYVTWINYCCKAYMLTGDVRIIDEVEKGLYNMGLGTVNYDRHGNYEFVFGSYSPLALTERMIHVSGGAWINENTFESCCVASGASGLTLIPRLAVTADDEGFYINLFEKGVITANTKSGNEVSFRIVSDYPRSGRVKIRIESDCANAFKLNVRIPAYSKDSEVYVKGEYKGKVQSGYYTVDGEWQNGDEIILDLDMRARLVRGSEECRNENGKNTACIVKGPLAYAMDKRLGDDMFESYEFDCDENGYLKVVSVNVADFRNYSSLAVRLKNGGYVHVVDYASAGKTYGSDSLMCLWIATTDFIKPDYDIGQGVAMYTSNDETLTVLGADGHFEQGSFYYDYSDYSKHALVFEKKTFNAYAIKHMATGKYLTWDSVNYRILAEEYTGSDKQLFRPERITLEEYKIYSLYDGKLLSIDDDINLYLYPEVNHLKQRWHFIKI